MSDRPTDPSAPPAAADPPDRPTGSSPVYGLPAPLGTYTLIERLGVGGMAEVFLATHKDVIGPETKHVVKRCLPHLLEDKRFIEMFLREGRTASRLHHENVVELHEIGHVGNSYFLVLEYVDGLTLRKLALRAWGHKKTLPMELIVAAIADAALGLHHAHTLKNDDGTPVNLVHRDVSPENMMINREGITKVLDFGIARAADATALTKTGELKGKIPFMAPEQIKGGGIDARADVYALGITFYWLLAGRRPHRAPTELALLNEILFTPVVPPSTFNRKVPPEIDELVMAMIERDRDLRPKNALVVYDALKENLSGRAANVVPFVNELMAMPDPPSRDTNDDPEEVTDVSVLPATPLTAIRLSKWERIKARAESLDNLSVDVDADPVTLPSVPVQRMPTPSDAGMQDAAPAAARALPPPKVLAAAAAGVVALGLIAIVALSGGDDVAPTTTPDAGPPLAVVVDAGVVDAPPPDPITPPDVPDPDPPPVVEPTPTKTEKLRKVQLNAPPQVQWSIARGSSVRGTGSAELPTSVRSVRAVDKKTGGVSVVPIDGSGTADYAKLGSGTLEVRALPYAKVTVGSLDLGTTPFSPRALVEGTYDVKLMYESRVEKRSVKITKGRSSRIVIDFRKK